MEKNIKKQARKVEKLQESLEQQIYRHSELWSGRQMHTSHMMRYFVNKQFVKVSEAMNFFPKSHEYH